MHNRINVTAPYIPDIKKYNHYVAKAFDAKYLTNNGPLLQQLENRLKEQLNVQNLLIVNNGTTALQLAYKIKGLANKNVLTTPYTFAATSTALDWEKANIEFAGVDNKSWNIAPSSILQKTNNQKFDAIVPVNLFGMPCDLEKIDLIGSQQNIPIIYDSAHALFSTYKGKSIFAYGDIHCVSFHATKLFHSTEGGAIIFKNPDEYEIAKKLINFGISDNQDIQFAGINGKMSELHAAMGLCVLDDIDFIVEERQSLIDTYKSHLSGYVNFQDSHFEHYSQPIYMPVQFSSLNELERAESALIKNNIFPRRYFMPSHLKFLDLNKVPEAAIGGGIAAKVLCLPLMNGLAEESVVKISEIIKGAFK